MYMITGDIHNDEDAKKALDNTCKHYKSIYKKILSSISHKDLTFLNAKEWFKNLPLRYANNYYPEEVNQVIDECFKLLYDYCIKEQIIDSNITYVEFYDGKGLCNEDYPISRWYGENGPLGRLLD